MPPNPIPAKISLGQSFGYLFLGITSIQIKHSAVASSKIANVAFRPLLIMTKTQIIAPGSEISPVRVTV